MNCWCCGLSSTGLNDIDANNITSDNITIFSNLNVSGFSNSLNIDNLQATSNFGALIVSGASTINSILNIQGVILSEGLGIVDSSTNTNHYQLLVNPPTLATDSTIQTIQQNVGYIQILNLQPNGGSIKL